MKLKYLVNAEKFNHAKFIHGFSECKWDDSDFKDYERDINLKELRNVIERILIMAPNNGSTEVTLEMIPAEISSAIAPSPIENGQFQIMGLPLREAREIFEREYLISQVSRFGGNISRTAIFVGMERSALHRKLKALGVQSENRMQSAND